MDLKNIGFYTLSDDRVKQAGINSPLWRCELILTANCNFKCPYCRHVGGKNIDYSIAESIIKQWSKEGLKNIRFSGGEPTLYNGLIDLVKLSKSLGIERIALSTNGSMPTALYEELMTMGVNDFSISLDACCAADGDKMAGNVKGSWGRVVHNIKYLAKRTYVTVGVVLTEDNNTSMASIIKFAHALGVADIRVIPAAQEDCLIENVDIENNILMSHPILKYRIENMKAGRAVRGIYPHDSNRCGLVIDDMAAMSNKHYPCIIYMREGGNAIGNIGPSMRKDRETWSKEHDTHKDPICSANCLDVCKDYNNKFSKRGI